MRWLKNVVILLLVIAAAVVFGKWYLQRGQKTETVYRTATIQRDELVSTIDATGTLEPEEVIDVGAQVAGQIIEFGNGTDGQPVDYGSRMEQGSMLARIDDAIYLADVTEAKAQLEQAKAGVTRALADKVAAQSRLDQAQRDWDRAQALGPSDALAQSAFDTYLATFEQAKANLSVSDAAIIQAQASVSQAESTLMRANRNLGYCTINSPVTGVIIDRRVNIGQTVVASLNAPSLFLLAKDLKKMEVWVAVNEADIGRIYEGQPVEFTVDAFPGREFKGAVSKIRLNASMTNNVVTYVVELSTDNPDELLLPYLTANVRFEIYRNTQALIVPNAALRWVPPEENISPSAVSSTESTATPGHHAGPSTATATTQPATDSDLRAATLWVRDGAFVRPIEVMAGNTDTIRTEVFGSAIHEGMEIVTGIVDPSQQSSSSASPFIPQIRRGAGRMR